MKTRRKTYFAIAACAFLTAGILISVPLFLLHLCLSEIDASSVSGPAPIGNYAVRRAWGEKNLHHHFASVDEWIRQSEQIADDIGTVTGVAPIGSPNSYGASFGESWARLNLQVIGTKGEGILHLPDVCADDPRNIYGVELNDESWSFTTAANQES